MYTSDFLSLLGTKLKINENHRNSQGGNFWCWKNSSFPVTFQAFFMNQMGVAALVFAASHQLLTHFQREIWGALGKVPDRSCSQNITPYCPIKPLYNPYIGGICWYISRVLSHGYPTLPFDICPSTRAWNEMVEKALSLLGSSQDL